MMYYYTCGVGTQVQQLRVGAADNRFADLEGEPVQGEPTETEATGRTGGE